MKKEIIVLPLLLLGACAEMTGEAYDDGEYYDGETGLEVTGTPTAGVGTQPMAPATGTMPQGQQPVWQEARISPDGKMIELPAQKIYLTDMGVTAEPPMPSQPAQLQPAGLPVMSYSAPIMPDQPTCPYGRQPVQPAPEPQQIPVPLAVVTLQNVAYPNTFAQCAAADMGCIMSYEQQGYRQVRGNPQFAGYQDGLSHSDYPGNGRYRNGNNIPRW